MMVYGGYFKAGSLWYYDVLTSTDIDQMDKIGLVAGNIYYKILI